MSRLTFLAFQVLVHLSVYLSVYLSIYLSGIYKSTTSFPLSLSFIFLALSSSIPASPPPPSSPTTNPLLSAPYSPKLYLYQLSREFEPQARNLQPGSRDLCFLTETPVEDVLKTWIDLSRVRTVNERRTGGGCLVVIGCARS